MEKFKSSFNTRSIVLTKSLFMGYLHEHQEDVGLLKLIQRQTSKTIKTENETVSETVPDNATDPLFSSNGVIKTPSNTNTTKDIKENLISLGFDISDDMLLGKAKEEFFRLYKPLIMKKDGEKKDYSRIEQEQEVEYFTKEVSNLSIKTNINMNIVAAITLASQLTDVDSDSLLKILSLSANVKLGLKTDIIGKKNLYGFSIEGWLSIIKECGHKYGLKIFADQIVPYETDVGMKKLKAKSPIILEEILMMRDNINISTIMAAEELKQNKIKLAQLIDNVGISQLFLAHYLGLYDAIFFLDTLKNNPDKDISKMFKKLSTTYPEIVYNEQHKPRKLSEAYEIINLIANG